MQFKLILSLLLVSIQAFPSVSSVNQIDTALPAAPQIASGIDTTILKDPVALEFAYRELKSQFEYKEYLNNWYQNDIRKQLDSIAHEIRQTTDRLNKIRYKIYLHPEDKQLRYEDDHYSRYLEDIKKDFDNKEHELAKKQAEDRELDEDRETLVYYKRVLQEYHHIDIDHKKL